MKLLQKYSMSLISPSKRRVVYIEADIDNIDGQASINHSDWLQKWSELAHAEPSGQIVLPRPSSNDDQRYLEGLQSNLDAAVQWLSLIHI